MNKADLVNSISQSTGMTKTKTNQVLDVITSIITETLAKGDKVTAPGLPDFIHNPKDFISQDCVCI
jgi:DNA-binding protein HU-beta